MLLQEKVPLASRTTLGVGGAARWFAEVESEDALVEAVRFARERDLPFFVLGGGSNLLVADEGFPGLVAHPALRGVTQESNRFRVAGGENWDAFVSRAVALNFGGIECLAGIPGSVGGTPVQNVGAYGQEVSGTIELVRVLDLKDLRFVELPAAACGFAYRESLFNTSERGRYVVTRVDYRLEAGAAPSLRYADLQRYFRDRREAPTLAETAAAVREIRHGKGMLLVEGEADCRSAGSFFKNPVVAQTLYDTIAAGRPTAPPFYPAHPGRVKIPAAWLLEQAGFHKGFALGRAGISSRHTLALVNLGGATAAEIAALRDRIVTGVEEKFGIRLEPEPVWLGPESRGPMFA
ncbi:MAG TPA: UDP-N-acetylmuramate dehydrogenase [Acidobacteriaceae bacterium]|jgi:UDP-N-acetylmuramate dehydrogenase|nr:UDP-N-acetylmuramate dehydrogenase [Acidobacteriaceae bacterium]